MHFGILACGTILEASAHFNELGDHVRIFTPALAFLTDSADPSVEVVMPSNSVAIRPTSL